MAKWFAELSIGAFPLALDRGAVCCNRLQPAPRKLTMQTMPELLYSSASSPFGRLYYAHREGRLVLISFGAKGAFDARCSKLYAARPRRQHLRSFDVALEHYLKGGEFVHPHDLRTSGFVRRVLEALLHVPRGSTVCYGALAAQLGTGARAVGRALGANPLPLIYPCHRVIRADGSLGGFTGGLRAKKALLRLEGADF